VTDSGEDCTGRFRLLANSITGRAVEVATAGPGEPAHTDGRVIFVSGTGSTVEQRCQVLAQSALLRAGSLDAQWIQALRARPTRARRYLALEGNRVLCELAQQLPLAAAHRPDARPVTATADESLDIAKSRKVVADPPDWFGVIKPALLLGNPERDLRSAANDFRFATEVAEAEDDSGETDQGSAILRLFENPLMNSRVVSEFLRKLFGTARSEGTDSAGAQLEIGARRRTRRLSAQARAISIASRPDNGEPSAVLGVGAALYPEWDAFSGRYRPDWCRVRNYPITDRADVAPADAAIDVVLRKRLSRIALGPRTLRRRSEGDELDTEALVEFVCDLRSGHSPSHNVYTERRTLARELGVLLLLDVSGSATESDPTGRAVHEHQRRAAATLATTLEEVGDRVALYAFRSEGPRAVHLLGVKGFGRRFGAASRGRLNQIQPAGYTRMGAAIRGAAAILKTQAGTSHRLLLVLSDGSPYDHGYEGHYAEADTRKALEEVRCDGIAVLCLAIGSGTASQQHDRVYGSAHHVSAETLAELSPRMDELFLLALRELAAPSGIK
jgi:nitric oxide reductase NorD protein